MVSTYQNEGHIKELPVFIVMSIDCRTSVKGKFISTLTLSFKKSFMGDELVFYSFTSDYTMDKLIEKGKAYCAKLFKKSIEWK